MYVHDVTLECSEFPLCVLVLELVSSYKLVDLACEWVTSHSQASCDLRVITLVASLVTVLTAVRGNHMFRLLQSR